MQLGPIVPGQLLQTGQEVSAPCIRLKAWIWVFSSSAKATAWLGGLRYSPRRSRILVSASGSVACERHL